MLQDTKSINDADFKHARRMADSVFYLVSSEHYQREVSAIPREDEYHFSEEIIDRTAKYIVDNGLYDWIGDEDAIKGRIHRDICQALDREPPAHLSHLSHAPGALLARLRQDWDPQPWA
jgi:hypothetical protein